MKARFRTSSAASEGFEVRETSRSAALLSDIRVFASTIDTTVPVCEKDESKIGSAPWEAQVSNIKDLGRKDPGRSP